MSHTYHRLLVHVVFSTKERKHLIPPALQSRLFAYLGGIANTNGMNAIAVGGVEDHVHILLSLPATLPVAKAVQLLKGGSAKWVHDSFPEYAAFEWQQGYGAFTIGAARAPQTVAYIQGQTEHHRTRTFDDEFLSFLKSHGIAYDPQYVFG